MDIEVKIYLSQCRLSILSIWFTGFGLNILGTNDGKRWLYKSDTLQQWSVTVKGYINMNDCIHQPFIHPSAKYRI